MFVISNFSTLELSSTNEFVQGRSSQRHHFYDCSWLHAKSFVPSRFYFRLGQLHLAATISVLHGNIDSNMTSTENIIHLH